MTDTTKDRNELIEMAADELTITGSDGTFAPEDQQKIDSRFDGLMAELSGRGIVSIADEDEIPIEWCGPLAELLANECARAFGKQKMPDQMREGVEERLRVLVNRSDIMLNFKLQTDPALRDGTYGLSLTRWARGG